MVCAEQENRKSSRSNAARMLSGASSRRKLKAHTKRPLRPSAKRKINQRTLASMVRIPPLLLLTISAWLLLARATQAQQQQSQNQAAIHNAQFANSTPLSASQQQQQLQPIVTTQKPNYLKTGRQITGILDRFMSLGYDKRVRPNYGGPPVEVNVTMRILSISSVSEVMMDFTADFYFRQTWHDPRLSFEKLGDIQTLYVGAEVSKKIWLPDTFFGNEKMAYFHEATTPNVFLRIDHSGEVYRSIRLTVTSSCPMNLQYFPMDRQRCTIEAESYGYNVKDIIYRWAHPTAVERDKEISLPQFDIVQTVQKYRLEELSSGTYSRLIAEIHFARRMGYYLIQIYIPSSLIVVISWVSFWLHRNASPARVQLGVTTVLTMTTLMSSTNAALPKISYVKSIDIFLGTCFVMVFAALLEYATVGYLGKRIAMRKAHAQHAQSQAQAKLFAQLQAQGAQGDPVPLIESGALSAALIGANSVPNTSGPTTLFGNTTDAAANSSTARQQAALSGQNTPLSALLSDPTLLSAVAAAAAAAAATSASSTSPTSEHQHSKQRQQQQQACSNQQALSCIQVAEGATASGIDGGNCRSCSCDMHEHFNNSHSHHSSCHARAANLPQQQQQRVHDAFTSCPHHALASKQHCQMHSRTCNHNALDDAPQAPPRRNLPQKLMVSVGQPQLPLPAPPPPPPPPPHARCSCECQTTNNFFKAGGSQTLPRNATFARQQQQANDQAADYRTSRHLASGDSQNCCRDLHLHQHQHQPPSYVCGQQQHQQQQHLAMAQVNSTRQHQPSPSKGAASAAAAAAATFVNLHRKNKGLPPSTNPNFAPFATPHLGPLDRRLETIFGIRPSDIDKYSRVVFPVCFVCFQLMYWIVYLHISAFLEPDQHQQQQMMEPLLLPTQPKVTL